jgi:hypothetical protein
MSNLLRLVRPINDTPAVFARPGYSDHKLLCQLISEGRAGVAGAVFDAAFADEQGELLKAINRRNLWSVLDPKSLELSTPGGFTPRRRVLPWAGNRPHAVSDFDGPRCTEMAQQIVQFVADHGYSAVLAPAHYLARGFGDPWLRIDLRLLETLRTELDRNGAKDVAVYYPLSIPTDVFFDPAQRLALKQAFRDSPALDALWLRVHPFGGHSGHVTLESYIRSARDLQEMGTPLVGEKVGSVGSALLAFGALGGVDLGISSGESFDYKRLLKKSSSKGFAPHRGVLLATLGISLDAKAANVFFENRTLRANYGCHDTNCCRTGVSDTIKEPRRHFLLNKLAEVGQLGTVPYQDRPSVFLEKFLRPATDKLVRVSQADIPSTLKRKVDREQRKMSGWRNTLGEMSQVPLLSPAKVPAKRVERLRGAA